MKIIERIADIISINKLSVRAFELKIGASNGMIGRAIAKKTDISAEWLSRIIEALPATNPNWLLTGEGPMISDRNEASSVRLPEPAIVYIDNPDKNDLIALQREKIRSLEMEIKELKRGSVGGFVASEDFTPVVEIVSNKTHNKS